MHRNEIIYALICVNNHVLSCLISILSMMTRDLRWRSLYPHRVCQKDEVDKDVIVRLCAHSCESKWKNFFLLAHVTLIYAHEKEVKGRD